MERNVYRTALEAIKDRIANGQSAPDACDDVIHQLRRLIGDDRNGCDELRDAADQYEEDLRDAEADSFCCSQDPSMRDTHGVPGRDL